MQFTLYMAVSFLFDFFIIIYFLIRAYIFPYQFIFLWHCFLLAGNFKWCSLQAVIMESNNNDYNNKHSPTCQTNRETWTCLISQLNWQSPYLFDKSKFSLGKCPCYTFCFPPFYELSFLPDKYKFKLSKQKSTISCTDIARLLF